VDSFGDVAGFLIMLAFVGVSLLARAAKKTGEQPTGRPTRPQWPGPVAGPPGAPPNFPRPWSPGAQQPQAPMAPASPSWQEQPGRPLTVPLSGEGVGTEGPSEGERVEAEINRFDRESEQFAQKPMDEVSRFSRETEQFEGRHLTEMKTALTATDAAIITAGEASGYDLQGSPDTAASLAQAMVMAEILAKPRALRRGRRM
jgi:hypothetical protein